MANKKHLNTLKYGVGVWNQWREENPALQPDLRKANLSKANLEGAYLRRARLLQADLISSKRSACYVSAS